MIRRPFSPAFALWPKPIWVALNTLLCGACAQLLAISVLAQGATVRWARDAGGTEDDIGLAIAADAAGNTYVTGLFTGRSSTFGRTNLSSHGGGDVFVAKYDNLGNVIWAASGGGAGNDEGRAIAVDPSGNVYVTGSIIGPGQFGNLSVPGAGMEDMFVGKLDSSGHWLWIRTAGGTNFDEGRGIGVDNAGHCYVTGVFSGSASFGQTNLISQGRTDIVLAKYDTLLGQLLWARSFGGTNEDESRGLAVDSAGQCYVTGFFNNSAGFGNVTMISRGLSDIFLGKFDADGELLWVRQAGGTNLDEGHAVALDPAGNVHLIGIFEDAATFGGTNLTARGVVDTPDVFTACYDPSGALIWIQKAGGDVFDSGYGIAADAEGNSYVAGLFLGTAYFGSNVVKSSSGQADIFVAKYDPVGNLLWVFQSGGTAYTVANGIAVDGAGSTYEAGYFRSSTTFGGLPLTNSSSGRDVFIARVEGPPRLRIDRLQGEVFLSWPTWAPGFQLQSAAALVGANLWSAITNSPATNGQDRTVIQDLSSPGRFYRLRRP